MPVPKGFGISNPTEGRNTISRTRNYTAQTADLTDSNGEIINQVTHGAAMEESEEYYADDPAAFKNQAVDGQTGKSVVTGCQITENAADWAKATVTTRHLVSAKATAGE